MLPTHIFVCMSICVYGCPLRNCIFKRINVRNLEVARLMAANNILWTRFELYLYFLACVRRYSIYSRVLRIKDNNTCQLFGIYSIYLMCKAHYYIHIYLLINICLFTNTIRDELDWCFHTSSEEFSLLGQAPLLVSLRTYEMSTVTQVSFCFCCIIKHS